MDELFPGMFEGQYHLDAYGVEYYTIPITARKSPLLENVTPEERSRFSSDPRPTLTAWEGADRDAYWFNGEKWLHCRTGEVWQNITQGNNQ